MDSRKNNAVKDQAGTAIGDVICEFLEVAFHLILYCRSIYPDGIFKKCRKYNVAVMMSCHPDLNSYIKDVLVGIRSLISAGNAERVTLQIVTDDGRPFERYVFEISLLGDESRDREANFEPQDLERQLRDLLLKIYTSDAFLKPSPSDCSFAVLVQTSESIANKMVDEKHFEGFPWVKSDDKDSAECFTEPKLVPLKSCSTKNFDLQCFVEMNVSEDAVEKN